MKDSSYIELSRSALKKNINYLKRRIGKDSVFVSVIKGNAYGHGIEEFLTLAEECGADHFMISEASEAEDALNVKRPGSDLTIMNHLDNEDIRWAIDNDISFFVFEPDRLEHAVRTAQKAGNKAKIHIEFETGFHRTGFTMNELGPMCDLISRNLEHIELEGFLTHYAGAESIANYVRINEQKEQFNKMCMFFESRGIKAKYKHTACSAAALTYPDTIMDMARIGIAQYGFWPSKETRMYNLLSEDNKFTKDPLHRVLSWKTKVLTVKNVTAGQFIGYGNSYMATKNEKIAVIPIGYAHGYSRSLSNLGNVLIRKHKVPVVGMVNMNMIIVNVTNVPGVTKGDEVVLIGKQGKQQITVASFADLSRYVNYELLTRLPDNIPRFIVK